MVPSLFQQVIMEAEDDPVGDTGPPEEPMDDPGDAGDMDMGGDPPELGGGDDFGDLDMGGDGGGGEPPAFGDDGGGDDLFGNDGGDPSGGGNGEELPEFDDKVSDTLNARLYQDFLKQLNTIGAQITLMKNNSDVIYAIAPESVVIQGEYEKLEENIRIYLDNYFNNRIYSENLLFFTKTLNLLKLNNDKFKSMINKGVKSKE